MTGIRRAARAHKAALAIDLLKPSIADEQAGNVFVNVASMYPPYLRGQALLLLRQGKESAAEFQKIIDHPGVVLNFFTAALARLGLARAYALQGDTAHQPVEAVGT